MGLNRAHHDQQVTEDLFKAAKKAQLASDQAAEAAQEVARAQEYFALVNRARERIGQAAPGWSWDAAEHLTKAAALPTPSRSICQLRSDLVACYAGLDVREKSAVDLSFIPHRLAYAPDGKWIAVGQSRSFVFSCVVALIDPRTRDGAQPVILARAGHARRPAGSRRRSLAGDSRRRQILGGRVAQRVDPFVEPERCGPAADFLACGGR